VRQRGVTLIELIIVIVALTAGVALIGTAYMEPARSIADNENVQLAWQAAQACADYTIGRARALFSNVALGSGQSCPAMNGITPTFSVVDASGSGACTGIAGSGICRSVTVSAVKSGYTAQTTFTVANY
jgi:prepilin-type N-terminal cleavage/methylation domain-containing protein